MTRIFSNRRLVTRSLVRSRFYCVTSDTIIFLSSSSPGMFFQVCVRQMEREDFTLCLGALPGDSQHSSCALLCSSAPIIYINNLQSSTRQKRNWFAHNYSSLLNTLRRSSPLATYSSLISPLPLLHNSVSSPTCTDGMRRSSLRTEASTSQSPGDCNWLRKARRLKLTTERPRDGQQSCSSSSTCNFNLGAFIITEQPAIIL